MNINDDPQASVGGTIAFSAFGAIFAALAAISFSALPSVGLRGRRLGPARAG